MANLKLAVAIARVNAEYDANLTYQQGYMAGIAGRIPVERNKATDRLEVDETAIPAIAKAFGLAPVKKAQPVAKPGPTRPARPRATRLTA
jgi:hypothetical protein